MDDLKENLMRKAYVIAEQSKAKKRQVGAVIYDTESYEVVSTGYNRTPIADSLCENENGETFDYVIHAEEDAIMRMFQANNYNAEHYKELYVTYSPCYNCCKLIVQSGIKSIYYSQQHKTNFTEPSVEGGLSPEQFLIACGIKIQQISKEDLNIVYNKSQNIQSQKSLIIYHNKDNDGLMSCYLLYKQLSNEGHNVSVKGYNYESNPDWIEKLQYFDNIYFVDVTPEYKFFLEQSVEDLVLSKKLKIFIFDHHVTFFEWWNKFTSTANPIPSLCGVEYNYVAGMSATKIIWNKYLRSFIKRLNKFKYMELDLMVELVNHYDTWNFTSFILNDKMLNIDKILYFDTFMREHISDFEEYFKYVELYDVDMIFEKGEKIIEHIQYDNQKALKTGKFDNGIFMLNHNTNYWLEELITKEYNPDIMCFYKFKEDGNIKFSLRSRLRNDMNTIAGWYGGGGHRQAAGFEIPFEKGLKIINNHDFRK